MKATAKKFFSLLLTLAMVLSLVACGGKTEETPTSKPTEETKTEEPTTEKKFKVGWSCHYWNAYNTGMDDYIQAQFAKYPDIEVITTDAGNDATKQIADIEDLIAQGIDVLIVKAQDDITISEVLGKARDAGVMVILLQRIVRTDNYDYFVGANMVNLGHDMGMGVLDAFPEGNFNYVMLEGGAGSSTDLETVEGVAKVFQESGLPGIVKLDGQNCQANRAESKTIVEDWLTAYGEDIDVLLSCNDEMLLGAIQAIKEAGIEKKIYLAGVNCVAEMVPYIEDGTVDMSFALAPGVFPGIEIAVAYLHGEDLSSLKNWYEIPCAAVTPDTIGDMGKTVRDSGLYMLGLLEPTSEHPLFQNLGDLYPELVPLLHDQK